MHKIENISRAPVQALQLDPKPCGYLDGRQVIDVTAQSARVAS